MPKKCIYLIAILQAGKSLVYTHVYLLNERKQQGVSSIRSWLSLCQPFRRRRPKTSLGSIIIRCYGSSANSPFHHIKFLLQQLLQPIICHCIKSPHIIFSATFGTRPERNKFSLSVILSYLTITVGTFGIRQCIRSQCFNICRQIFIRSSSIGIRLSGSYNHMYRIGSHRIQANSCKNQNQN